MPRRTNEALYADVISRRRYAATVDAYDAARKLYREYRAKDRPPEVAAFYEAAQALLEKARKEGA